MTWADVAVDAIRPWYTVDYETYMRALMSMFSEVEFYAEDEFDDDGRVTAAGWSKMLDPDKALTVGLPFLAQWVGERLPVGINDADARAWIKAAPNQWRGTPYSVAAAAQRRLTGSRLVQIRERSKLDGTSDPDWIAVQVFSQQTPDVQAVRNELRQVIPADLMLDFQVTDGATWLNIQTDYSTWAAVEAARPTWAEVAGVTAGYISWLDPR